MDQAIPRRGFLKAAGAGAVAAGMSSPAQAQTPASPLVRPADLILKNGKVITVDAQSSVAQAIAIQGERILAVGADTAMAAHTAPATSPGGRAADRCT